MKGSDNIQFLGTAGSRFVVAKQLRASAGVLIRYHGLNIIMDPGPGTLVRCVEAGIDVTGINAIILTHSHIDHSNDVNILIDAMTSGGIDKKGILFAPEGALKGKDRVVLNYVQPFLEDIKILKENTEYRIGELGFRTSARHQHPVETYGVKLKMNGKTVSFVVDTKFFPELASSYMDSDILIMNVTLKDPYISDWVMHLCVEEAEKVISEIQPDKVILTHFGTTMLDAGPDKIAQKIAEDVGVNVMAGKDGMTLDIS